MRFVPTLIVLALLAILAMCVSGCTGGDIVNSTENIATQAIKR